MSSVDKLGQQVVAETDDSPRRVHLTVVGQASLSPAMPEGFDEGDAEPLDEGYERAELLGEGYERAELLGEGYERAELLDGGHEHVDKKPRVRARTISIKRLSKRELDRGRMMYPETEYERPSTRGDCQHGPHAERPCPFVSCKHHLYLDVNERTGSIKVNFPDLEVWDLPETCTLDVAARGGITLEEVGEIMNLTRERIRQLETRGLAKLKAIGDMLSLQELL